MKIYLIIIALILFSFGCSKDKEKSLENYYEGEIVNFDLNCGTCILKFPNDSITIKQWIGPSINNYFQTTNLPKDTFKIGQRVFVKLRKAADSELKECITLYPSYNYISVYIIDFK